MGFTIPNETTAGNGEQAEIHEADLLILVAGLNRFGVLSGCAVSAQGTPDLTVAVAPGTIALGAANPSVAVSAGNATITPDATNPRYVLVEVDSAGGLSANAGTPAANPLKPTPTPTKVALAEVYVPAADTAIGAAQIVDKRVILDATTWQPLDSDLTAIAALTTTAFGRSFLALVDAAAGRTLLSLGTAATSATGDFDAAGAAAAAQAASQPLDSDLTAIAALTTTAYGRSLLEAANAAALRTLAGLVIGTNVQAWDADLDTLAAGGAPATTFLRALLDGTYAALTDARLSDARPPTGAAGGALAGTFPSPDLAAAGITDAHVAPTAAIAESKLALASDATASTPSRRQSIRRSPVGFDRGDAFGGVGAAGTAIASGIAYFTPIWVTEAESWSTITLRLTTVGSAGALLRCAVYHDDGTMRPLGSRVIDLGQQAATASPVQWAIAGNLAVTPGLYWLAIKGDAAPATQPIPWAFTSAMPGMVQSPGAASQPQPSYAGYFVTALGTGGFADPIGGGIFYNGGQRPAAFVRVVSRP